MDWNALEFDLKEMSDETFAQIYRKISAIKAERYTAAKFNAWRKVVETIDYYTKNFGEIRFLLDNDVVTGEENFDEAGWIIRD